MFSFFKSKKTHSPAETPTKEPEKQENGKITDEIL
jgi:hypothetical protein